MGNAKKLRLWPQTDSGNAELFAVHYKDELRFDHARRRWLIWRGHWWSEDTDGELLRRAKRVVRFRYQSASTIGDDEKRKGEADWARSSESRYRLEAMIMLARAEKPLADSGTDWDSNPWLFGVANGVVDLRIGQLRKGLPADRITMHSLVECDPHGDCTRWIKFVREVFGNDDDLFGFVQRAVGYSLTGDTREQCLFLTHGEGANGKSTFLEVIRHILGDYAQNTPFSTLELKGRSSIPNDVAALVGKRFVTAIETSDSERLNEARIKALTGSDHITARFFFKEFFTFLPVSKIWLASNHLPIVADDSHGFWRRVRLIPFLRRFEGDADDKGLKAKLLAEAPGILAWAIQGCLAWQKRGLGEPNIVKKATADYREESDPLSEFIEEVCLVHAKAQVTAATLWEEYFRWTQENRDRHALNRKAFVRCMEARGFRRVRLGHNRTRYWLGICRRIDSNSQGLTEDTRTRGDAKFQ